jgi:lysocardiolipin and lysophospholipid acyltransferase
MHWRRYRISDIPVASEEEFAAWLAERWNEKDEMIEKYMQTGRLPAENEVELHSHNNTALDKTSPPGKYLEAEVRPSSNLEFLQVYIPLGAAALLLNVVLKFMRGVRTMLGL